MEYNINRQSAAKALLNEKGSTTIPTGSTFNIKNEDIIRKQPHFDTIFIYTLSDPITNEIRYIGKTKYPLYDRLCKHMLTEENNHRGKWIRKLKRNNLKPKIELLDTIYAETRKDWEWLEIYWISQFKSWGFRLLNGTIGGETGIISEQCRNACIEKNRGRKNTEETILRKRIAAKDTKLVYQFSLDNKLIDVFYSTAEAARKTNTSSIHIGECCKGKRKTHKKFIWRYQNKI